MPKPPSLTSIARAAGLAKSTVSYALRNHPSISTATCKRVQELARTMGYRPNDEVSRVMRMNRKMDRPRFRGTIAYLTNFDTADGWRAVTAFRRYHEGAHKRAAELGYQLELVWARDPAIRPTRLSQILKARGIQGLVVSPFPAAFGELPLLWENFASVAIGFSLENPILHRVTCHHFNTMMLALQRLKEMGYQRFGLAMRPELDAKVNYGWSSAFLSFHFQQNQGSEPLVLYMQKDGSKQHPKKEVQAWYKANKPEVILSSDRSVCTHMQNIGLKIPQKVGFVSLDWSAAKKNPMAGVDQKGELIGSGAVDMVIAQLGRTEHGLPQHP